MQRRLRELPSRVGVYFVLALGMYPRLGYARVWGKLTAGLEASVARWLRFFVESVPAAARPHRLGWRAICGMFGQPRPTWLQHPCFLLPARSASVAVWWHAKCVRGCGRQRRSAPPGRGVACPGDGRRDSQPRVQPRIHPQHSQRLAAYWAEALGGPAAYSAGCGDQTSVVQIHSGNGPHEEMDRRAIECFDQAMHDAGLEAAGPLRQVLHDYFAWATTTEMARYHQSADEVPEGMTISRWSWNGLQY